MMATHSSSDRFGASDWSPFRSLDVCVPTHVRFTSLAARGVFAASSRPAGPVFASSSSESLLSDSPRQNAAFGSVFGSSVNDAREVTNRRSRPNLRFVKSPTRVKTPLCRLMCYIPCRMNVVTSTCAGQAI